MSEPADAERVFLDTNIILYALSADTAKADIAEALMANHPIISVQVLNETANVLVRKLKRDWADTRPILETVRALCTVVPVTEAVHERAVAIAASHQLNIDDAAILAAAHFAGASTLYSEDMQDGFVLDGALTVRNPFAA